MSLMDVELDVRPETSSKEHDNCLLSTSKEVHLAFTLYWLNQLALPSCLGLFVYLFNFTDTHNYFNILAGVCSVVGFIALAICQLFLNDWTRRLSDTDLAFRWSSFTLIFNVALFVTFTTEAVSFNQLRKKDGSSFHTVVYAVCLTHAMLAGINAVIMRHVVYAWDLRLHVIPFKVISFKVLFTWVGAVGSIILFHRVPNWSTREQSLLENPGLHLLRVWSVFGAFIFGLLHAVLVGQLCCQMEQYVTSPDCKLLPFVIVHMLSLVGALSLVVFAHNSNRAPIGAVHDLLLYGGLWYFIPQVFVNVCALSLFCP